MLVFSGNFAGWYGAFNMDLPGLVPVFFQLFLVPVYLCVIFKEKTLGVFNRYCAPLIAAAGGLFLIFAANLSHDQRMRTLLFGAIFIVFMGVGALMMSPKSKK